MTLAFRPGLLWISCQVMSLESRLPSMPILLHSQSRKAEWAYRAAGVAWLTRALVTKPIGFSLYIPRDDIIKKLLRFKDIKHRVVRSMIHVIILTRSVQFQHRIAML